MPGIDGKSTRNTQSPVSQHTNSPLSLLESENKPMCPQSSTGCSTHTHQHQPPRGALLFLLQTKMSLRTGAGFCSEPDSPREGVLLQGSGHGNRNLQGPATLSPAPASTICYPSLSTSACISPHFNTPVNFLSTARLSSRAQRPSRF